MGSGSASCWWVGGWCWCGEVVFCGCFEREVSRRDLVGNLGKNVSAHNFVEVGVTGVSLGNEVMNGNEVIFGH